MTKFNIKTVALVVFVFIAATVSIQSAYAADINFDSDTNISVDSNSYLVANGSRATSLEVGASTITVTVPGFSSFKLYSMDRYLLNNNSGLTQDCTSTHNGLIIFGPATVVITPVATVCAVSGGGSVDTSGGGGTYVAPVDTTPPTSTSVSISAGAATTNSTAVTLTLSATDAAQMMISNDPAFSGGTWETYATSKSWTLSSGEGTKTVYAQFKDSASNVSTAVSDTITYSAAAATQQTTTTATQQLGPITISKPLTEMTRDELVNTLLRLVLTLIAQGKLTHL